MRRLLTLLIAPLSLWACFDSTPVAPNEPCCSTPSPDMGADFGSDADVTPELVRCATFSADSIDLGRAAPGYRRSHFLTVTNCGRRGSADTLEVAEVIGDGDGPAEFVIRSPDELSVRPGETVRFRISFEPHREGFRSAELVFQWAGAPSEHRSVFLRGYGNTGSWYSSEPVAVPKCRVDGSGAPFLARLLVPLGAEIECTAADSRTPSSRRGSTEWVVANPGPAPPRFEDDVETVTFTATGLGEYVVGLRISNSDDEWSEQAFASITSLPPRGLFIDLAWTTPRDPDEHDAGFGAGSDLDLHLLHPNGCWEDPAWDCHFRTRGEADWGEPGIEGDPQLLVEDTDGAGPEQILLADPKSLMYRIGVHAFNDHGYGESTARLRVFVGGSPVWEAEQTLLHDEWWVSTISWPSMEAGSVDVFEGVPPCTAGE